MLQKKLEWFNSTIEYLSTHPIAIILTLGVFSVSSLAFIYRKDISNMFKSNKVEVSSNDFNSFFELRETSVEIKKKISILDSSEITVEVNGKTITEHELEENINNCKYWLRENSDENIVLSDAYQKLLNYLNTRWNYVLIEREKRLEIRCELINLYNDKIRLLETLHTKFYTDINNSKVLYIDLESSVTDWSTFIEFMSTTINWSTVLFS